MPILFHKTLKCGCIIETLYCGYKTESNGKQMYMLGGHKHFVICNICKKKEEIDDTLYDMWKEDNITDDFEFGEWKLQKNN